MIYKRVLRKGTVGVDVKELQKRLNELGYKLAIDGIFGSTTEGTVRDFQRKRNLVVDGIVGPITFSALNQNMKKNRYYRFNNSFILEVDPLDLSIEISKRAGNRMYGNFINGSFFDMKNMRSISTLVSNGNILAEQLPHDTVERGTFVVYKDGIVKVEMIDFVSRFEKREDIKFAIGGFNIMPQNKTIKEQLKDEWFDYNSVGYKTWRSLLGYISSKNKVLIIISPNTNAEEGSQLLKMLRCDIGIGLDSGGSTSGRFEGVLIRNTSRVLHNIIRW